MRPFALRARPILLAMMFLLALASPSLSRPLTPDTTPDPLKPWVPWVLQAHDDYRCPFLSTERRCAWPSQLSLDLTTQGGTFQQQWTVFAESTIPLPGNAQQWPQDVTTGGRPVVVIDIDGLPHTTLSPGSYSLTGRFSWDRIPEYLRVPAASALVQLRLNQQPIPFPKLDATGQLWIHHATAATTEGVKNSLDIQVFRRLTDSIPFQLLTRIQLDVSGEAREVLLGQALLPQYIPLALLSPLPARLEPDGRLRLQIRPGRWTIDLTARAPGQVQTVTLADPGMPWSSEEVWSIENRPDLRLVELTGLDAIDPQTTSLPQEWRALPAYHVTPGHTLTFNEKRRGDSDPAPDQLNVTRALWLDFDGKSYTIQDRITGTMTSAWRLEMAPPVTLGQVTIAGQPEFITRLGPEALNGIEVRHGTINLTADSRLDSATRTIPAVGWNHSVQQLRAVLHLPPGWSLFSAQGPDSVPGTWVAQWTLLDLFILLIVVVAVAKLFSKTAAAVALLGLGLTYHETGAPTFMWLHLIAATALCRALPTGTLKQLATLYRGGSLLLLVLIAVPFAVQQVRVGLYPQLQHQWQHVDPGLFTAASAPNEKPSKTEHDAPASASPEPAAESFVPESKLDASFMEAEDSAPRLRKSRGFSSYEYAARKETRSQIQTGPGLPVWQWRQVQLAWNGPVQPDEMLTLILISPGVTLVMNFAGVILVLLLLFQLSDQIPPSATSWTNWVKGLRQPAVTALVLLAALMGSAMPSIAADDRYPSEPLLQELTSRLLQPPPCLPHCADIPAMHLTATASDLRLRLSLHAQIATAIPLPGHPSHWMPNRVSLDGHSNPALTRQTDGTLWLQTPAGTHHVILEGPLPKRSTVQLPLPLPPHRTTTETRAWKIAGLHENGTTDPQLLLTAVGQNSSPTARTALEAATLPPFLHIERTLIFDLTWRILTTVTRLSPMGSSIVEEVPLLPGESVTSDRMHVKHHRALVSMGPGQESVSWQSVLTQTPELTLAAPVTPHWVETWQLRISPLWHPSFSGIAPIHHGARGGDFAPEYRPWPGEALTISLTKPIGAEGVTVTIDHSHVTLTPGNRATGATLDLTIRSSQGGQHPITLPPDVSLTQVTIDGVSQPIRLEDRTVRLPIHPGTQHV
ncbi:MAG: hypothetical protein OEV08_00570, partial [Nitrospira sp.]|nr:hypothetical protein [Nitrospira sp.]